MKNLGDMPLETVFKFFLYIVVILVIITMIANFRNEIVKFLRLCNWLPQACEEGQGCTTIASTETTIDKKALDKYCSRCWSKTGEIEASTPCICYVVQGSFSPMTYSSDICELKCNKQATSVRFTYDHLLKKVFVEC